jgi:hypothetical protein
MLPVSSCSRRCCLLRVLVVRRVSFVFGPVLVGDAAFDGVKLGQQLGGLFSVA